MSALEKRIWDNIDANLAARGRSRSFLKARVPRDKNTYSKWFSGRILIKIRDLEEIAAALDVEPSTLLAPGNGLPASTPQMELLFEPGLKSAKLVIECAERSYFLRPATEHKSDPDT